jgi:spore germination cell wall hydrolase CwlJ-like protein
MKKAIILIILWILFVTCYIAWGEEFYTPNEVVASVICAEACGEGEIGMYGIANVIANRAKKYNITPYEVVTQKNQFYGYTNPNREKLYNQCKEVSDRLTANIMQLDDITGNAFYFKTANEKKQPWHLIKTIKIGKHIFYK